MTHNLGDVVWYAARKWVTKTVQCPDCAGKGRVMVTLGDGEQVHITCSNCNPAYAGEPGAGYIYYSEQIAAPCKGTITEARIRNGQLDYVVGPFDSLGGGYYAAEDSDLFLDEASAAARAAELAAIMNEENLENAVAKVKEHKTWAWNASYHRREIKRLTAQLEHHQKALAVAANKAKEPGEGEKE